MEDQIFCICGKYWIPIVSIRLVIVTNPMELISSEDFPIMFIGFFGGHCHMSKCSKTVGYFCLYTFTAYTEVCILLSQVFKFFKYENELP